MTGDKIREKLLIYIRKQYGTQKAASEAWGVSKPFVSRMVRGDAELTQTVLDELGYTKQVVIIRKVTYKKKPLAVEG